MPRKNSKPIAVARPVRLVRLKTKGATEMTPRAKRALKRQLFPVAPPVARREKRPRQKKIILCDFPALEETKVPEEESLPVPGTPGDSPIQYAWNILDAPLRPSHVSRTSSLQQRPSTEREEERREEKEEQDQEIGSPKSNRPSIAVECEPVLVSEIKNEIKEGENTEIENPKPLENSDQAKRNFSEDLPICSVAKPPPPIWRPNFTLPVMTEEIGMGVGDARKILGYSILDNKDTVQAKFKKLARVHHPDRGGDARVFCDLARARKTIFEINKWEL